MSELPVGWTKEPLAKLGTWTGGGTPSTTNADFWTNGTIPWVSPKDMKQRRITTAQDSITEAAVRASATNLIPENSVMLVTRSGILRHSLPVATNTQPVTLNQDMKALTPLDALLTDYLYFVFRRYEREILHGCCKAGTTVQSVEASRLMAFEIPVPPLPEQLRIVAKIEELFSELDAGVANLKKARAQLAVYRQALLKHAFEGKLTAEWRAKHAAELESAEQLLERIRAEREARYQQQLKEWERQHAAWEKSDGSITKPSKPGKPVTQSPISSETQKSLPNLPAGWAQLRLGELIDEPAYGTSKKCDYETNGTGVLRIPNVVAGSIDATDLKFASFTDEEIEGYSLEPGDLLMIRSNGSVSIVGRCAMIRDIHTHLLYAGYLIRLRPHASAVESAFLHWQLFSHQLRHQIEQAAKSTSGVNNINSGEIQSLIIAVCSVAEQREIVIQLEEKLSAVSALEADIDLNLQKAEALRQSILKKAFAGELVPQDPADEPADALLARIRAEREAQAAAAAVAKTGKPRKTKVP